MTTLLIVASLLTGLTLAACQFGEKPTPTPTSTAIRPTVRPFYPTVTPTPAYDLVDDIWDKTAMVAPMLVDCEDRLTDAVAKCMVLNGRAFEWGIEGFDYQEGYAYHLTIKRPRSTHDWRLVELHERIPAADFDEGVYNALKMVDQPCPVIGEPVSDFWRDVVFFESADFFGGMMGEKGDYESVRADVSRWRPGAIAVEIHGVVRQFEDDDPPPLYCPPTWWTELIPWRDRCAKVGSYSRVC